MFRDQTLLRAPIPNTNLELRCEAGKKYSYFHPGYKVETEVQRRARVGEKIERVATSRPHISAIIHITLDAELR